MQLNHKKCSHTSPAATGGMIEYLYKFLALYNSSMNKYETFAFGLTYVWRVCTQRYNSCVYVNYTDEEVFTLRFHCLQKRRWRALLNEGLVRRLSSVICNMYTTSLQYLLYLPGDYKVDGWMEGGGGEGDQTRRRVKRRDGREGSSCWAEAGDSKEYYHNYY